MTQKMSSGETRRAGDSGGVIAGRLVLWLFLLLLPFCL
jgi:hypothetical protein